MHPPVPELSCRRKISPQGRTAAEVAVSQGREPQASFLGFCIPHLLSELTCGERAPQQKFRRLHPRSRRTLGSLRPTESSCMTLWQSERGQWEWRRRASLGNAPESVGGVSRDSDPAPKHCDSLDCAVWRLTRWHRCLGNRFQQLSQQLVNQQQTFQQSLVMQRQQSQAQVDTLTNLGAAQVAKTTYDARDIQTKAFFGEEPISESDSQPVAPRENSVDMANFNTQLHRDVVSLMEECTEGFEIVRDTKTEVELDTWRRPNHKYDPRHPLRNIQLLERLLAPSQGCCSDVVASMTGGHLFVFSAACSCEWQPVFSHLCSMLF